MTTAPADMPPGPGILLHLVGPLQSWGVSSRFPAQRDTAAQPTRSGLIGLIAAALGYRREDGDLELLRALRFTVRTDRSGTLTRDLHTVGGGMPRHLTVATAEGKRRSEHTSTLVSHRNYLQDAAFTAAVHSHDRQLLRECADALRRPTWAPYLGRRACPPNAPFLLGTTNTALRHLVKLPLARRPPRRRHTEDTENGPTTAIDDIETVPVDFTSDLPLDHLLVAAHEHAPQPGDAPAPKHNSSEAQDDPLSFAPQDRRYRTRGLYQTTVRLPASQCGDLGTGYLTRLITYFDSSQQEDLP